MTDQPDGSGAEVVGVHGIDKHHSGRRQLLQIWTPALGDGIERAAGRAVTPPALDIAFYGDVFLDAVRAPGRPSKGRPPEATGDDDADADELAALLEAAGEDAAGQADKGRTRTPGWAQALMRAVDRRFGSGAGVFYLGVFRQVRLYLTDPVLKDLVDERVAAAVGSGCRVLVGHSLGSVVAYEYLRQNPGSAVERLVTLGSPLGLRMVRERLPAGEPAVDCWINVRDPHDPVTCAGALDQYWPAARDEVVDNGPDAHLAEHYLGKRTTGHAVLGTLPGADA